MSRHPCLALSILALLLSPSIRADDAEKPIAITAEQLWKAFDDNGVKASMDYEDRVLEVTGRIFSITKLDTSSLVGMGNDKGTKGVLVYFFFDKSEEKAVAALLKGKTVTIIGKCLGRSVLGSVNLDKCRIKTK